MQVDYHNDEELQVILGEFNIIEPKLQCYGKRAITRICVNPKCYR